MGSKRDNLVFAETNFTGAHYHGKSYHSDIIPALKSIGLSDEETRRSWAAFGGGGGVWSIHEMTSDFGNYVRKQPEWQERRCEGYLPISVDITAYFRPTLQGCPGVHFHPAAQRALPAINIGRVEWATVGLATQN
ncbi:hypothetical protein GW781_03510 [bacterium]|nr:hypothetical protein [bacterium]NCT20201.1 hypothetical protein [bacterium]